MKSKSLESTLPLEVDTALADVGLVRLGDAWPGDTSERRHERRQAFYQRQESGFSQLSLVRGVDGVLRWHEGGVRLRHPSGRRASRAALPMGNVEKQYVFESLHDPNQIAAAVRKLDSVLARRAVEGHFRGAQENPEKWGLYKLTGRNHFNTKVVPNKPGQFAGRRILLFVHGTFSHCDGLCKQIRDAKANGGSSFGQKFLKDARARYDLVLAFNHPTLSVSPMVNAFRLAALLRDSKGPPKSVDVVCHSRGGLVARWWLEGFATPDTIYRVMFIASPLGGTSLASPARLKSGMDLLSNVCSVLGKGAAFTAVPLIQVAGGVLKIISSVTGLVAKTPALDAAVATIPGLMSQSRVSTNFEIKNLRAAGGWQIRNQDYFAVRSNFVPPPGDKWKFWRAFTSPRDFLTGWTSKAVDDLVFVARPQPGDPLEAVPNDLVVDCPSMQELADGATARISNVYDFGDSSKVHHMNYFEQEATLEFIRKSFGVSEV